jgi:hypothetical protein
VAGVILRSDRALLRDPERPIRFHVETWATHLEWLERAREHRALIRARLGASAEAP